MKIVEVNTYTVRPRWGFVEIVTDEGLTGWGEPVLEGHCATVLACVQEMKPYLIGKDPMRIEDFSAVLYRAGFYRGGGVLMSAIAGIDQALWDIKGKFFNAPVYQLMGGACRDNMRVYSWIGGDRPSDVGTAALERKNAGFTAIKMNATVQGIDTLEETIQLLTAGRIDATLNADVSFYDYLNVHPDADFKLVAQTEDASHVAIPVRKGDDSASLLEAINTAIEELRADGTLKALGEKYFGQDISSED